MARPRESGPLRRMHKAKPSRAVVRQQLTDAKQRIGIYFGNFLVLLEEGSEEQAALAKQKARSELLKIGPELEKLAQELGDKYTTLVRGYLDSMDTILYAASGWIDEAKITAYFNAEQKFEKSIQP